MFEGGALNRQRTSAEGKLLISNLDYAVNDADIKVYIYVFIWKHSEISLQVAFYIFNILCNITLFSLATKSIVLYTLL